MTDLFDITQINGMTLPNRFVRSAPWTRPGT
jgi:2,4-dienoyl-CoA reductase-like NADH-dependent reductase (Old Yellow Enzyme family)